MRNIQHVQNIGTECGGGAGPADQYSTYSKKSETFACLCKFWTKFKTIQNPHLLKKLISRYSPFKSILGTPNQVALFCLQRGGGLRVAY